VAAGAGDDVRICARGAVRCCNTIRSWHLGNKDRARKIIQVVNVRHVKDEGEGTADQESERSDIYIYTY